MKEKKSFDPYPLIFFFLDFIGLQNTITKIILTIIKTITTTYERLMLCSFHKTSNIRLFVVLVHRVHRLLRVQVQRNINDRLKNYWQKKRWFWKNNFCRRFQMTFRIERFSFFFVHHLHLKNHRSHTIKRILKNIIR